MVKHEHPPSRQDLRNLENTIQQSQAVSTSTETMASPLGEWVLRANIMQCEAILKWTLLLFPHVKGTKKIESGLDVFGSCPWSSAKISYDFI